MSELINDTTATLWYVAKLLTREDGRELADHHDHDCYAGMLVMQELILALYPEGAEVTIPVQRVPDEIKEVA